MKKLILFVMIALTALSLSGCAYFEKARRADTLEEENAALKNRLAWIESQKEKEVQKVAAEKEKEISELEEARRELEKSLKKEIGDYKAKLQMTERGLVITFVSEVFFDSGKNEIKEGGKATLAKVAAVLNKDVPDSQVAVEGHTDNDPIKRSGWKSNWELSSARALSVLHYLIDQGKVNPRMLSADGYGQYHPVAPNDTPQNKRRNRRVEIVILPSTLVKPVNR
jgi:chemotaxis protein MotB